MTNQNSGSKFLRVSAQLLLVLVISGCQTSRNYYRAESIPKGLAVIPQANPQEVDLTRLASVSGSSEMIGPGDLLNVAIAAGLGKDDLVERTARVGSDGFAPIPGIGRVELAGNEPQGAEALIRMEAVNKGLYLNPTVTVSVVQKKMNRIRVIGAVKEPQIYELPPNASDVVSAIAAAGGLADNAGENVEIRNPKRGGSVQRPSVAGGSNLPYSTVSDSTEVSGDGMNSYSINLISASVSGTNSYNIQDGGVVMVEKRDPAPLQVTGLVNKPDTYDYPIGKPLTVLGAISKAGGLSNQLADKVFVIRPLANPGDRALIEVSLRKAKRNPKSDLVLGPGDIVSVEQTAGTVFLEALQLIRVGITGSAGIF
ncbi:MAG: SLBB domain-containing protein [Fuerstiella sp.]